MSVCDIDQSELIHIADLGCGSYAFVYKALWGDRLVAVKKYTRAQHMPQFENEVRELARAVHPNVVSLFARSIHQRLLVLEFSEMGSLQDVLDNNQYKYNAAHAVSWARQAAEGVAHLHNFRMLHRDLKPANMLLFNRGLLLKLSDFGTSCLHRTFLSHQGTPPWIAPEVWICMREFLANNYDEKCDVYSWAVSFWQMISRRRPYENLTTPFQVMEKVINGDRLPLLNKCPTAIQRLILDCWHQNSSERPTMSKVVKQMAVLQKLYSDGSKLVEMVQRETSPSATNENPVCNTISTIHPIGYSEVANTYNHDLFPLVEDLGSLVAPTTNSLHSYDVVSMQTLVDESSPFISLNLPSGPAEEKGSPQNIISTLVPSDIPTEQSPTEVERSLMDPKPVDPNAPLSSHIFELHCVLRSAFVAACARIKEAAQLKKKKTMDLEKARSETHAALERKQQFLQISAENEDLVNNILPYVSNSQGFVLLP